LVKKAEESKTDKKKLVSDKAKTKKVKVSDEEAKELKESKEVKKTEKVIEKKIGLKEEKSEKKVIKENEESKPKTKRIPSTETQDDARAPKDTHKIKLTPKKYLHGKKYRAIETLIEKGKEYSIEEAVTLLKKTATTNFDSSVEIHVNLGIDPSNADHQIRGSVIMPAGTGRSKKICAIVGPDHDKEAKSAGADYVGGQDLVEKIQKGWLDFEVVVATPDMMPHIGRIGKILGTKGLMPNPKTGTVTNDPAKAIQDIKKGKADYKIDKQGSLHAAIGKISFTDSDIIQNINSFLESIRHSKPASLRGTFIKSVYLTTSMGPSVKIQK